jgi:iron complex transport system ATP-binding protein
MRGQASPCLKGWICACNGGTLVCLMGPNGAGKSTLLRTLTGLMPALGGVIRIGGDSQLLQKPSRRARAFSLVLTDQPPVGLLRVRELVAIGRHPYTGWAGVSSELDRERVAWALDAVHASDLASRLLHTLSDGERQRVMIARALAQDCPLMFLDEPTAFLDLPHRIELMHILQRLTRECGLTLLMSTHDLELAMQYADTLWLLGGERRWFTGTPEDLLLEGKLEHLFSGQRFSFDRERGVFHVRSSLRKVVKVSGDRVAVRWTINALEKLGIGVATEHESGIQVNWELSVQANGTTHSHVWEIVDERGGKRVAHSIESLKSMLQGMVW